MSSNASLVAETLAMVLGMFDTNEFILDLGVGTRYYPWGEALNGIYMGTGLHTLWLAGGIFRSGYGILRDLLWFCS